MAEVFMRFLLFVIFSLPIFAANSIDILFCEDGEKQVWVYGDWQNSDRIAADGDPKNNYIKFVDNGSKPRTTIKYPNIVTSHDKAGYMIAQAFVRTDSNGWVEIAQISHDHEEPKKFQGYISLPKIDMDFEEIHPGCRLGGRMEPTNFCTATFIGDADLLEPYYVESMKCKWISGNGVEL